MVKIKDIMNFLEEIAPLSYQEDYDNSGLIVGDETQELKGILVCLDSTEEVIDEAINHRYNLVIAHHPIIFGGLKKITGSNYVERAIIKAIKQDIAVYAIHTNLDNVKQGVNKKIAEMLDLVDPEILSPGQNKLMKLVTFIPKTHTDQVLEKIHQAGAGKIGDYDHCSFRVNGTGRFKPGENADPYIGTKDLLEEVNEDRVEVIFPAFKKNEVLAAMNDSHPYEEVAYYLHELANLSGDTGSGMIGNLQNEMQPLEFLDFLKKKMSLNSVRYTPSKKGIKKVAVCGGAGSFLLPKAIKSGADVFITADMKYHDFFDGDGKTMIIDIGHYESEQFTKELIYGLLSKKFSNIALRLSEVNTNPIRYI
ncbi:MAG: Nif3-like dinuclear metal center hexameric protein [Cyclobacteriaceae bacterium]|nr:Nif3-like dinuclear metal center hexameric protein [Cyclobacteriaceae bacterium]